MLSGSDPEECPIQLGKHVDHMYAPIKNVIHLDAIPFLSATYVKQYSVGTSLHFQDAEVKSGFRLTANVHSTKHGIDSGPFVKHSN